MARATALGLHGVVLHPGCYTSGSKAEGLRLIAEALLEVIDGPLPMILLEHTAGQGTSLGSTFDDLATIIEHMHGDASVGVCLDTCHLFASGYDIATPEGYADTFRLFERTIGLPRLKVFHLNDSRKPLGSRVDRHTHIGEGCIGSGAFRRIVNDRRFRHVPMLLETPKEEACARTAVSVDRWDEKNLNTLRRLVRR
jgi:deoxyribonuclease-4